jgi:phosphotransferase system IIA component
LWHFDTDFDFKIQNEGKIFKRLLSTEKTQIKLVNSDSLLDFDKDFLRLKNTHTLIGISITSSSLSLFNGE